MKKIVLAAVVALGAGIATSQAGTFFGISIGSAGRYPRGGWVQPPYAYPNVTPYYGGDTYQAPVYRYPYPGQYYYPYNEHGDMHRELQAEHHDMHQDLDATHWAEHQQLNQEAAQGVPRWVLNAQHRAEHRNLDALHADGHGQLQDEHAEGHDSLR